MAFSNASRRAFFARKATAAKAAAAGSPAPTRRAKPANDNATRSSRGAVRSHGANLGRTMTVAMTDACVEAAGFDAHASY